MAIRPVLVDPQKIKAARGRKRWSQAQLVAATGLSEKTIYNIESGQSQSIESLALVATALGLDLEELLKAGPPDSTVSAGDQPVGTDLIDYSPEREIETCIGLPNIHKGILGRDEEAKKLLEILIRRGPQMVSIAAPGGFGKTATFVRAVQLCFPSGNPRDAGINGVVVLDARQVPFTPAIAIQRLARITEVKPSKALMPRSGSSSDDGETPFSELFFQFLKSLGSVWLVIENAENALGTTCQPQTRELLDQWCEHNHQVKLLLLTREAVHPPPRGLIRLPTLEEGLLKGIPENAAVEVLREHLDHTSFRDTEDELLRAAARKLYYVPIALEQFAGYLKVQEGTIAFTWDFVLKHQVFRLFDLNQPDRFLGFIISEQFNRLDPVSQKLVGVVAWAPIAVPRDGLLALAEGAQPASQVLTKLMLSELLVRADAGRIRTSFTIHPLLRHYINDLTAGKRSLDVSWVAATLATAAQGAQAESLYDCRDLCELTVHARQHLQEKEPTYQTTIDLVRALLRRGESHHEMLGYEDSINDIAAAMNLLTEIQDETALSDITALRAEAALIRARSLSQQRALEALEASTDAVGLYEDLEEREKGAHSRFQLARAVMSLANSQSFRGLGDQAIANYERCRSLLQDSAAVRTPASTVLLSSVLNNWSLELKRMGRFDEALHVQDEAIGLARELTDRDFPRPPALLPLLAGNRALILANIDSIRGVRESFQEALALYRRRIEAGGEYLQHRMASLFLDFAEYCYKAKAPEEGLDAVEGALAAFQHLQEQGRINSKEFGIAKCLRLRAKILASLGRLDDAIRASDDSVKMLRQLRAQVGTEGNAQELSRSLWVRTDLFRRKRQWGKMIEYFDEIIILLSEAVNAGFGEEESQLAQAIGDRGTSLAVTGQLAEASRAFEKSCEYYRNLIRRDPRPHFVHELKRMEKNLQKAKMWRTRPFGFRIMRAIGLLGGYIDSK